MRPKSVGLCATRGGKQGTWPNAAGTGFNWKVWKRLLQGALSQPQSAIAKNSQQQSHSQRPFHCWFLTFNRSGEGLPSGSKVMLVSEPHATSLKLTNNVRGTISTT